MPKVSIIIPAYNAMNYLPETLKSILFQTFSDFEVLIINDGSTDNIVQWARELPDPRVRLIVQENQGVATARNTGINHAKGKYIAFLDADDLWEPTKLEKQVNYLINHPEVGLLHTSMTLIDSQGNSSGRVITSNAEGNALKKLLEQNTVVTSSVIVRYFCLKNVGEFNKDLRYSQDWEMWVRIATRYSFAVIKEPLVYYRQHFNNATKNWQMLEQGFGVIEKLFQLVPKELIFLKNRSYGYANIYLAWKALQNGDRQQATYFRNNAIAYYSRLRYSPWCIRLSIAIAIMEWLGFDGFNRVLVIIYAFRRRIVSIFPQ
ncbi:glycosyltransferase family 2 protein [Nostoc sp. PA-18-2419]|uniref:glycosyltransferase family 2 protein n=1 Tax=Nostoc sp. PA-18-2419 TaxID=2575443 RepID=UPI001109F529|nr:glycosyltransferase family 2 protein [Nostoc sp. PA-18-2419]